MPIHTSIDALNKHLYNVYNAFIHKTMENWQTLLQHLQNIWQFGCYIQSRNNIIFVLTHARAIGILKSCFCRSHTLSHNIRN